MWCFVQATIGQSGNKTEARASFSPRRRKYQFNFHLIANGTIYKLIEHPSARWGESRWKSLISDEKPEALGAKSHNRAIDRYVG